MNRKLLIDYGEVRNLFNEEYKKTMQLIQDGENHLDNLAEGFAEADRVLFKLLFLSPQTNADLMRAMSDEELASILGDKCICPPTGECARQYGDCISCWLDWLKQPVKDGEDL